ncbi:hypothetical protein F5876DRAFT_61407 [Lentinula aff. lateritia]|uniref:Uncharacterized protein n=1 Tax=Lentinula aff. lateritia TaxID=2804960 RepID=A0ACC1UEZ8_9AGAR|nr:hypothetical protein F5876DRAFT_61407 [Lentinula aff. lateritia]
MRLPSSSSLVLATLAISSSSSTLCALAAPAGDHAQAQSGVSSSNNQFRNARRDSVSHPRAEVDYAREARSEEQTAEVQERGLLPGPLCSLPLIPDVLGVLGIPCPGVQAADVSSLGVMSADNTTDTNPEASPIWSPNASNSSTSSYAPSTSSAPSRRDASPLPSSVPPLPVDPNAILGGVTGVVTGIPGKAGDVASQAPLPQPVEDKAGTVEGALPIQPGQVPSTVTGAAKDKLGTVEGAAPQPIKNEAGTVENAAPVQAPVRRSHRARRDAPAPPSPPPGAPSPPVQPPVQPSAKPPVQPPVQPPISTATVTSTSTVTETAAPTSA